VADPLVVRAVTPYYSEGGITIYHGDCREILPEVWLGVDLVLTDPPYPDYYEELYRYFDGILDPLNSLPCRQLVFWSGRADFPLSYTAVHIWNKNPSNHGAQYERIFERNGGRHQKVFTYYMVNSTVAASMTGDIKHEHPSQKPIRLMRALLEHAKGNGVVVDPFAGSGTTLHAARDMGRRAIGIEIEERYCEIAAKRLAQGVLPLEQPA
jgi:site-specific DNA-methyltransferase (adenine-specific)